LKTLSSWQNDVYHPRSYVRDLGQNSAILRTSHLSYLIGFEKNVVLTETGSAYVLNGRTSRYLNLANSAPDISVDVFKRYTKQKNKIKNKKFAEI